MAEEGKAVKVTATRRLRDGGAVVRKVRSDAGKKRVPAGLRGAAGAEFDAEDLAASAEVQGGGEVAAALGQVMEALRGLSQRLEAVEGGGRGLAFEGEDYRSTGGPPWSRSRRWRPSETGYTEDSVDDDGYVRHRYLPPQPPRRRMPDLPEAEIGDNLGLPNEFWSQFAAMFLKTCNVLCPVSDAPTREAAAFVRWTGMVKQYARQRISGYRPADLKKGGG